FAAPSAWVQKRSWAGLHPASASAATLCWRGATRRLGLCDPHSSGTARQHTQQDGRAAPATPATGLRKPPRKTETQEQPVGDPLPPLRRWLLCAGLLPLQGPAARRALWELAPGCHEPGGLDTRDSGGENEPTFMSRAN